MMMSWKGGSIIVSLLPAATRLGMDSTESDGCQFFINLDCELIMSVMFSQAAAK